MRTFLTAFVKRVGAPSADLHWEIFPKQEKVEEGQLGNLIKLPLGIHRITSDLLRVVEERGGTITLENWVITRSPDTGGLHIALRM